MPKKHYFPEELLYRLDPADMGLVYTSVQRLELGEAVIFTEAEETCLVVIQGDISYRHEAGNGTAVFCDMLYVPVGTKLELSGKDAVVMQYGAPCDSRHEFAHIRFADVDADARHKIYGKTEEGTHCDVWNCIDESFPSERFLVGICQGAPGGWTAWPPHEHGEKREEVYVYFSMDDGFAIQCVYEDMKRPDAVALVQDGHLVAIPAGYHPNVGCPKGGIRYVYCMVSTKAGDRAFMDLNIQRQYGDKLE